MANVLAAQAFNILSVLIFSLVSGTFLFPCNAVIPLDRRTVSIFGAMLCYILTSFAFHGREVGMIQAIDFDVLVLLASIMAINYVVIHLQETQRVICEIQATIRSSPSRGFWAVSFAAFAISPFLTNDGVCLLFVEPLLEIFQGLNQQERDEDEFDQAGHNCPKPISIEDAKFFLISLSCSSNIGSALTYTGNPQNMIVSEDAIDIMPPHEFLLIMILPAVLSWGITTYWIHACWRHWKNLKSEELIVQDQLDPIHPRQNIAHKYRFNCGDDANEARSAQHLICGSNLANNKSNSNKQNLREQRQEVVRQVVRVISSPFPFMILGMLIVMIVMIFVDIIPISSLVCISAVFIVVCIVVGNHWRGREVLRQSSTEIQEKNSSDGLRNKLADKDSRKEMINIFFDELFNSLDYSLLIIFLGLFIVVSNIDSTGIPREIWNYIAGKKPFRSAGSLVGISIFVLVASQFLGNVAIIQLAKPNVQELGVSERKMAWALISFLATIGGNLTITGSAANIIVAEKSSRINPEATIDFFFHFKICFLVTLIVCSISGYLIVVFVSMTI